MSTTPPPFVTVVSGLPRSGTSLMMQMLAAGGIDPITDAIREADDDNPRGYLEFERVKRVRTDQAWVPDAVGKAVKMVHLLVPELPDGPAYRVVFMRRRPAEVIASQGKMLDRQGRTGAALPPEALEKVFGQQIDKVLGWIRGREGFEVIEVWYHDVVGSPAEQAARVNTFLGGGLDTDRMASAVDPSLYRNRAGAPS